MQDQASAIAVFGVKVLNGPDAGQVVPVQTPFKFGRHPSNQICITRDSHVSRFHAELRLGEAGDWTLADLSSTNGTFKGDRLLHGEAIGLAPGETFRLGTTSFLFDWLERLQPLDDAAAEDEDLSSGTMTMSAFAESRSRIEVILLADMRSSTPLGVRLGETKMLRLKEEMFKILERAAYRYDTRYAKSTGDGYMMTFTTLADAVKAVRTIVGETARYNRQPDIIHPLNLRLAMTAGQIFHDHNQDRHGQVVNLCFRLITLLSALESSALQFGSEDVIPLITPMDLKDKLPEGAWGGESPAPIDLDPQPIKGFPEPVPVTVFPLGPEIGMTA